VGGKPTKYALHRIRRISDPAPAPPALEVEDEEEDVYLECSVCGDTLEQFDDYGECEDDGAVFCPACYETHQAGCSACLPPAEAFDDGGRTAIGNGYRDEPVVKPQQQQLTLF